MRDATKLEQDLQTLEGLCIELLDSIAQRHDVRTIDRFSCPLIRAIAYEICWTPVVDFERT